MNKVLDPVSNFAVTKVVGSYSAFSTEIQVQDSSRFPDPSVEGEYNIVWYNYTNYPEIWNDPNVEIVRVTAKNGNTLTISRAQEGTNATNKNTVNAEYRVFLAPTAKLVEDIDNIISQQGLKLSNFNSLQDAVTSIESSDAELIIDRIEDLNGTTVSIPSNIVLSFKPGNYIHNGSLTLNEVEIKAGRYRIFGDGLTLSGVCKNLKAKPEWWGAVAEYDFNNLTLDNRPFIQKAINDSVKLGITKLEFTHGIYSISGPLYIQYHSTLNPDYPSSREVQGRIGFIGAGSGNHYNSLTNFVDLPLTLLWTTSATEPVVKVVPQESGGYEVQDFPVEDIAFGARNDSWVIDLQNLSKLRELYKVSIFQYGTGGGIQIDTSWFSTLRNVYVKKSDDTNKYTGVGIWIRQTGIAGGMNTIHECNASGFDDNIRIGSLRSDNGALLNNTMIFDTQGRDGNRNFVFLVGAKNSTMENCHSELANDVGVYVANNGISLNINSLYSYNPNSNVDLKIGDVNNNTGTAADKGFINCNVKGCTFLNVNKTGIKIEATTYLEGINIEDNYFIAKVANDPTIVAIDGGGTISNNFKIGKNQYKNFVEPLKNVTYFNYVEGYNSIRDGRTKAVLDHWSSIDVSGGMPTVDLSSKYGNFFVLKNSTPNTQEEVSEIIPPNLGELENIPKTNVRITLKVAQGVTLKNGANLKLNGEDFIVRKGELPKIIDLIYVKSDNRWHILSAADYSKDITSSDRVYAADSIEGLKFILNNHLYNPVEGTIYITKPIGLDSDLIIGSNVNLVILKGAKFTGAYTLTINGSIEAGRYRIFNDEVILSGSPKVDEIYPEWFGAKGDKVNDDYEAIQKAMNLASWTDSTPVSLASKTYRITQTLKAYYDSVTNSGFNPNLDIDGRLKVFGKKMLDQANAKRLDLADSKWYGTIIYYDNTTGNAFDIQREEIDPNTGNAVYTGRGFELSDLSIVSNSNGFCFNTNGAVGVYLKNIYCVLLNQAGSGIRLVNNWFTRMEVVRVWGLASSTSPTGTGIELDARTLGSGGYYEDIVVDSVGTCVDIKTAMSNLVFNKITLQGSSVGMNISSSMRPLLVRNLYIEFVDTPVIINHNSALVSIDGMWAYGGSRTTPSITNPIIDVQNVGSVEIRNVYYFRPYSPLINSSSTLVKVENVVINSTDSTDTATETYLFDASTSGTMPECKNIYIAGLGTKTNLKDFRYPPRGLSDNNLVPGISLNGVYKEAYIWDLSTAGYFNKGYDVIIAQGNKSSSVYLPGATNNMTGKTLTLIVKDIGAGHYINIRKSDGTLLDTIYNGESIDAVWDGTEWIIIRRSPNIARGPGNKKPPVTSVLFEGYKFFNTDTKKLELWDGVQWNEVAYMSDVSSSGGSIFTKLSDYTSLQDAITTIGSTETELLIDRNETLTADVTVPGNITLSFIRGNIIDGAHTLIINGGIVAGLYQIFGSSVTVNGNPKITEVYPEWFGAVGDGITLNDKYIQKALLLGKVKLGKGTYKIQYPINLYSNYWLEGSGKETIIWNDGTSNDGLGEQCIRIGNKHGNPSPWTELTGRGNGVFYTDTTTSYSQGEHKITVVDVSGFNVGDLIWMFNQNGYRMGNNSKFIYEYQQVNKIIGISGSTIELEEPIYKDTTTILTVCKDTGNDQYFMSENVTVKNIKFKADNDSWYRLGGAYKCHIENIWAEVSGSGLIFNGFAYSTIKNASITADRSIADVGHFSHHNKFIDCKIYNYNETPTVSHINLVEFSHDNVFERCYFYATGYKSDINSSQFGLSFATSEATFKDCDFYFDTVKRCVTSGTADLNLNVGVGKIENCRFINNQCLYLIGGDGTTLNIFKSYFKSKNAPTNMIAYGSGTGRPPNIQIDDCIIDIPANAGIQNIGKLDGYNHSCRITALLPNAFPSKTNLLNIRKRMPAKIFPFNIMPRNRYDISGTLYKNTTLTKIYELQLTANELTEQNLIKMIFEGIGVGSVETKTIKLKMYTEGNEATPEWQITKTLPAIDNFLWQLRIEGGLTSYGGSYWRFYETYKDETPTDLFKRHVVTLDSTQRIYIGFYVKTDTTNTSTSDGVRPEIMSIEISD